MTGVALPGGGTLYGDGSIVPPDGPTVETGTIASFPIYQAGDGFATAITLGTGSVSRLTYQRIGPVANLQFIGKVGSSGASLGSAAWFWKTNTVAGNTLPFTIVMPGADVDNFGQVNALGSGYINDPTFSPADERFWPANIATADLSALGITTAALAMSTTVVSGDNTLGGLQIGGAYPYGGPPAPGTVFGWSLMVSVI